MFYPTEPFKEIYLNTGDRLNPLYSLRSDNGETAHICQHHGCLVVAISKGHSYEITPYIFKEAWAAMRNIEGKKLWSKARAQ